MKLRILLTAFAFSVFTAGIQGATPDLKKSSKTELSEKIAISPVSHEITLSVSSFDIVSDVAIVNESKEAVYSPTKAISKFVKHINSQAKKRAIKSRNKAPSENERFLYKLRW